MRARPFSRLARLHAWVTRRERAAWDRAARSSDDAQHSLHRNRSDRWAQILAASRSCPRTEVTP